ncbi:MAG: PA14 domain-containing protein [Caldimonas sp.]
MKLGQLTVCLAACVLAACGGGSSSGDTAATGDEGTYQAGPGPQGGAVLYSDFRTGKKLMLHQRDVIAVTPTALHDRLATLDATLDAFDGVFLRLPTTGDAVMKAAAVSSASIGADLAPVYGLKPTRLRFNFAVVSMQHDLDPFDDWTGVYANVGRLAKVARDAGLVGIVIDNESVLGLRVTYPYDLKFQTRTIEEYRAQTQLVSKKVMEAIVAEFPDAAVIVLRGAAGAEAKSPPSLVNCESREPPDSRIDLLCGASGGQLLGPFFAGFIEGKGSRSMVIDGGTDYGLRTGEQFAASKAWRKTGIASMATDSVFIGEPLRSAWPTSINVSFGVRELDGAHGNSFPNDPNLLSGTLRNALNAADNLVWASFDLTDMTKAAATDPLIRAARRARSAAGSSTAHLAPTTPASGTGLMAQYFSQIDESELAQTVVDPLPDYNWTETGPVNTALSQLENYSVVWTGFIEAPVTGPYTFFWSTDDGMQVAVDGQLVIDSFGFQGEGATQASLPIVLNAGQRYPIKVRWFQGRGGAAAHVFWQLPGGAMTTIPTERLYPTD